MGTLKTSLCNDIEFSSLNAAFKSQKVTPQLTIVHKVYPTIIQRDQIIIFRAGFLKPEATNERMNGTTMATLCTLSPK